jgi:hypothetical protein
MGCVHTHWRMPAIEGWGDPSHVWNVVPKTQKIIKRLEDWLSYKPVLALRPKHDKIRARWVSNVPLESMLERVWWCKHFEMESWSWTISCPMNCSNGGRHAWARGSRRSHVALRCCWKGNVLLTRAKVLRRKGRWSTINLTTMTKMTKAQLPK